MKLGDLEFLVAKDNLELMAHTVAKALESLPNADVVGVAEIDPTLSDTAAFCDAYQIGMEQAANCVVLEGKRAALEGSSEPGEKFFAACVILGSTRADVNGLAKRTLGAKKISFAPMESAVEASGMEFGAITPVGLPSDWPILVDKAVAESEAVIIGSGIRKSKLLVPGSFFASLPNVQVLEGLGQSKI